MDEDEKREEETNAETTEQRTDDYDGLARRLDDVLGKLDELFGKVDEVKSMYSTFVDAGAIVSDASDALAQTVAEAAGAAVAAELYDFEAMDFTI